MKKAALPLPKEGGEGKVRAGGVRRGCQAAGSCAAVSCCQGCCGAKVLPALLGLSASGCIQGHAVGGWGLGRVMVKKARAVRPYARWRR